MGYHINRKCGTYPLHKGDYCIIIATRNLRLTVFFSLSIFRIMSEAIGFYALLVSSPLESIVHFSLKDLSRIFRCGGLFHRGNNSGSNRSTVETVYCCPVLWIIT